MKIDTTKIPGFDALPDEAKAAITAMEFADAPDMTQYVTKAQFDKKASEAADLSKQLRSRMTEDEVTKAKAAEDMATIMAELETLRNEKAISEYTAQFLSIGYDEKLAKSTAEALQKGDTATMFKNHATFVANRDKDVKAELLKGTPTPPSGDGTKGLSREDCTQLSLAEKAKFASENPERYKEFYKGE